MMHLILADSELEIMPKIKNELLDSSLHHHLMKKMKIKDWRRRGRPDIAHFFLIVAMESILNKKNLLRVYIHTRNDEVIYIKPYMRIIKNYDRFKGLMKKLFEEGRVPKNNPLMIIKNENLFELLEKIDAKKILFTRKGRKISPCDLQAIYEKDVACIIGGFPSGYFITKGIEKKVDEIVSIYDEMLPAWTVAMEAIIAYEYKFCQKFL